LPGPARPPVHPGPDLGEAGRGAGGRALAVAAPGAPARPAAPLPAPGPGLLHRRRDPLLAGRPLPIPDAVAAARAEGPPPRRLVGVALWLRNVWVWLHWQGLSAPRRGGREVRPERLRFKTLLLWLQHVAEEQLGASDETYTERPLSQAVAT